jgi:mannose-6-phosphate isomerase-like protein (cupin superfamily)
MDAFEIADLLDERERQDRPYLEFLRVASLSAGLYVLPAGGVDPQLPHTEDEIYYVVSGRGAIRVGDADRAVAGGTVVFVQAGVDHRFHTIEEELVVLVFFAPAEYTRAPTA